MVSLQPVSRSLLEDARKAGLAVFLLDYRERLLEEMIRLQSLPASCNKLSLLELSIPALPVFSQMHLLVIS